MLKKTKTITFKEWLRHKWFEHCDEVESWTGKRPDYLSGEYFKKYKWWLKREYKSQQKS